MDTRKKTICKKYVSNKSGAIGTITQRNSRPYSYASISTRDFQVVGHNLRQSDNYSGLNARCYVDVTVTKNYNTNADGDIDYSSYFYTFDFTQQDGSVYSETARVGNRTETFFRDVIYRYLYSEDRSCDFNSSGTTECYVQ